MTTALTTRAEFKSYAGITNTKWDTVIDALITQASAAIERECNRIFGVTSYTEQYDGTDTALVLTLRQYPVVSVTDVRDDAAREFAATSVIDSTNYYVDTAAGIIRFDGWRLQRGYGNIRVTYSAGYSTVPSDIQLACHKLMGAFFNQRRDDGQATAALGMVTYNYQAAWSDDVCALIEPYVKHVESA